MANYWKSTQKQREITKREKRKKELEQRLTKRQPIKRARAYRTEIQQLSKSISLRKAYLEANRERWDNADRWRVKLGKTRLTGKEQSQILAYLTKLNVHPKDAKALLAKAVHMQKAAQHIYEGLTVDPLKSSKLEIIKVIEVDEKKFKEADRFLEGPKLKKPKTKALKAAKPVKADKPIKAAKAVKAKRVRVTAPKGQKISDKDREIAELKRQLIEKDRIIAQQELTIERYKNKVEGLLPGESLVDSVAQASDGTRDTYGDLVDRLRTDPNSYMTLTEKTRLKLLSSPKFVDVVFNKNPDLVPVISRDEIYKQLKEENKFAT